MKKIEDVNILVIGDIMLDTYIVGKVERISPEAPVPIVKSKHKYSTLGGSGNVVRNIRELGVNVACVGRIGNDESGSIIRHTLLDSGVDTRLIITDNPTTHKTRIIADRSVQLLRIDDEELITIDFNRMDLTGDYDIIIISDYDKGMITSELLEEIKKLNTKIIIDPKPKNGITKWYNDVFMITPNKKELDQINNSFPKVLDSIEYTLLTLGKDGMDLLSDNSIHNIEGETVNIYNVSGCGDTVIAIIGICISMGLDVLTSAKISNSCAAYVATQPGTSVVPIEIFNKKIKEIK
jgi:D-glycero-beta-D-manno-heptose-7-phosphate kinase